VRGRILLFLRQNRQTATAIAIPGETIMKAFQKTPLRQQQRKSQARMPIIQPTLLPPTGCSRGQVPKVTSPIQLIPSKIMTSYPLVLNNRLRKRLRSGSAGALGLRLARQYYGATDSRYGLFPAHPMPPPARPAFILTVQRPHWIRMHQLAPKIRDSRLGRLHRSTFLNSSGAYASV